MSRSPKSSLATRWTAVNAADLDAVSGGSDEDGYDFSGSDAPTYDGGAEPYAPTEEPSGNGLSAEASPETETLDGNVGPAPEAAPLGAEFDREATAQAQAQVGATRPEILGTSVQRFDDGTELHTTRFSSGPNLHASVERDTQVYDDGSKLETTRTTYETGNQYVDRRSIDSLDARLAERPLIDDARTATRDDVGLARDVLDNYGHQLRDNERATLNHFINDYYLGRSGIYGNAPPTPTNYPTIDEQGTGRG